MDNQEEISNCGSESPLETNPRNASEPLYTKDIRSPYLVITQ
jgi:hypothetical protein